jgi:hypothetical protein
MMPTITSKKNPGMNQPPICQPPHEEPDPQNIFITPGILNDHSLDNECGSGYLVDVLLWPLWP